ncbi:glycosyltransferase family 2 protein [Acinetobacter rathckeae]|uniref:glycosyltransferase family 2 protein n=1 Tax=Acinetobacter rathckeae TaxID=2605272 RepID=UPI0018A2DA72|nr:glycosyltransferase family 2 protein [Acinetobacter rathckeae]MBF7687804.1 glycosyltransferase family 2 protein [Acinetobacter rathckeae]MBF7687973.1 glycosyltransferase family 2 protein [Acinetobacter rathckeae]MBF7695973.1 glycosyltransferase family 2 protein [Acinetobacter rathckeae]
MKMVFIIPVYNHPHYLNELIDHLKSFNHDIIVVNDGSNPETSQILQSIAQHQSVILVEHAQNLGKGQAVMSGLKQAARLGYSHALQLDADGQHCWQDIPKFLEAAQQNPTAMVIGQPKFDASVPKKRLYGRYATHIWVWINTLSLDIKDSMCGFRVYPIDASLSIMNRYRLRPRMGFDSEILVYLKWDGTPVINIPTEVIYPENGISHFKVWDDNVELTKMHTSLFFGMLARLPKLLRHHIKG